MSPHTVLLKEVGGYLGENLSRSFKALDTIGSCSKTDFLVTSNGELLVDSKNIVRNGSL